MVPTHGGLLKHLGWLVVRRLGHFARGDMVSKFFSSQLKGFTTHLSSPTRHVARRRATPWQAAPFVFLRRPRRRRGRPGESMGFELAETGFWHRALCVLSTDPWVPPAPARPFHGPCRWELGTPSIRLTHHCHGQLVRTQLYARRSSSAQTRHGACALRFATTEVCRLGVLRVTLERLLAVPSVSLLPLSSLASLPRAPGQAAIPRSRAARLLFPCK
jgi:hypothetical protein